MTVPYQPAHRYSTTIETSSESAPASTIPSIVEVQYDISQDLRIVAVVPNPTPAQPANACPSCRVKRAATQRAPVHLW